MTTNSVLIAVAMLLAFCAAIIDLRKRIIPNELTYSALIGGPVLQLALMSWRTQLGLSILLLHAAAGLVLCGLVPWLLFRWQVLGGGDFKLLTALGGVLGPSLGLQLQFYAFLCGSVFAVALFAYRGEVRSSARRCWSLLRRVPWRWTRVDQAVSGPLTDFAFGPPIFVASVLLALAEWVA